MIRVLAIGDVANIIRDLKKYLKKINVYHIDFPGRGKYMILDKDTKIFKSHKLLHQVKQINEIKDSFDFCLVTGWQAAILAYVSGLDYIIWFAGTDITFPKFQKWKKEEHPYNEENNLNFFERGLYKKIFERALGCVTGGPYLYNYLKNYRKDALRIDRTLVDTTIFNSDIEPLRLEKKKFTFISPNRIGVPKGFDIIWKALPLCKTDFDVIQVEKYDKSVRDGKNPEFIKNKPSQIRLIPQIKREDMSKYYNFADAVIGNMKLGQLEGVGREAALLRKPLLNYTDPKFRSLIDGEEIPIPFLPTSNSVLEVAKTIDKIVESKEFRDELIEKQYFYAKQLTDPSKTASDWENLFEKLLYKKKTKEPKPPTLKKLRLLYWIVGKLCSKLIRRLF